MKPTTAIRFTEPQNALVTGLSCSAATSGPAVLSQEEFLSLIKAAGSDFYPPDDEQAKAVYADPRADLFIVAGPGTGKTLNRQLDAARRHTRHALPIAG